MTGDLVPVVRVERGREGGGGGVRGERCSGGESDDWDMYNKIIIIALELLNKPMSEDLHSPTNQNHWSVLHL